MSLLQIAEPNQSKNPHKHKYALGIDLGTTHSLVAVVRSGKAGIIQADTAADSLLPSVVYFGKQTADAESDNTDEQAAQALAAPLVGHSALAYIETDSKNTIASAKRFMGRSIKDIKFNHPYQLTGDDTSMPAFVTDQGEKTPVAVAAQILRTLYTRAEQALPADSIEGAVITVPAYFDEAQRQATKDAAKAAGINVLRLLNEPTAAAVAYGLDRLADTKSLGDSDDLNNTKKDVKQSAQVAKDNQYYLIYDLGGGTFDVSLLKLNAGVFEVLATGGNSALGGDDIDRLFANWLIKQAGLDPKDIDNQQKNSLSQQARGYKKQLSASESVQVCLSITDASGEVTEFVRMVSQDELTKIITPVSKRTLASCEQVLQDAQLTKDALDEVVLVGGSTRMPSIQKVVREFFDTEPLCSLNPDEVVALGAAEAANQLITESKEQLLLLDVTPLSLGLETMGGLVEVLIPRNTPIPVNKRQIFTTYQDGQNAMVIHVVQGERETVDKNRSLGQFILRGIPSMKAGIARIEVTFSVNADGQLTVTAEEANTGVASSIEIVPSYGLTEEQQESLLLDGFSNAMADKEARTAIETKVEAQREVLAIESALQEFAHLLSAEQAARLDSKVAQLETAIASAEVEQIRQAQTALKGISDEFASLIMNQSVQASMAGTSTKNWE